MDKEKDVEYLRFLPNESDPYLGDLKLGTIDPNDLKMPTTHDTKPAGKRRAGQPKKKSKDGRSNINISNS